jgi:chromosomal replication initiation ATPase DnaA
MMAEPARQLVFDLAHRQALGAEDLLVSESNRLAVDLVDSWPDWPHRAAVVVGPPGAGKTHLAHVWQLRARADLVAALDLSEADVPRLAAPGALVVEDIDRGLSAETGLFHLLNLVRENRLSMLLTARRPPGELAITLPDLRSRLRALPVVTIAAPDEHLLRGVLVKLFADRQLIVEPHVIAALSLRMERSMEAAARIVGEVDRLALERRQRVTRALVAEALRAVTGAEEALDGPADEPE